MEPLQPNPLRPSAYPRLQNTCFPPSSASSTPLSSPGLFRPTYPRLNMSIQTQSSSEGSTPAASTSSPFLHPLQTHKVKETHTANVDRDYTTGRKVINHYEVIDEIGRGVHGKVKLARNLDNGENVAIKIIPRFSKKRRLGRVTAMEPRDKTKKEIAILKKIRHPNVVALLEVIDDPELKKIYMVLEHVELGEIVWRKKGLPHICAYERRRTEREMRGEQLTAEEEEYRLILERRQAIKELKRAKAQQALAGQADYWSLEHGVSDDEEEDFVSRFSRRDIEAGERGLPSLSTSLEGSTAFSQALSRTSSLASTSLAAVTASIEQELSSSFDDEDIETPGAYQHDGGSSLALDGTMYGPYAQDPTFRGRSPSMADSIISHMSSIDISPQAHDPFADDFSYVPCFSIEQARSAFRDTLLGLEYLHYEGVVHRDIKPANLLWTKDHRVKISDFGVSYFGRPIRDGEPDETISESEAYDFDDDLELAKTVGTPAFFAPELCYTDLEGDQPRVSEQIDVWSFGVTLYCLIFARIPFMAEDEWSMFKKIAKEEVYIPSRRLRPVDPSTSPTATSLYRRVNNDPYRDDDDLSYEEIEPSLDDLLRRMLTKNPEKRIRLRDVKRHPWVLQGIPDIIGWIDDTDPSRRTAGRRIQVDRGEMDRAVVPLTLLERARSAVKKAVGKVIHGRVDRTESVSRRRAASSATSSAGESPSPHSAHLQHPRDREGRRKSLRGIEDYFATVTQLPTEHPLSHSVSASPHDSPNEGPSAEHIFQPTPVSIPSGRRTPASALEPLFGDDCMERQAPNLAQRLFTRQSRAGSSLSASLLPESQTVPTTPVADRRGEDPISALRKGRDIRPSDDASRAQSVDRGLVFASANKRAEAKISLSTAVAPGSLEQPRHPRQVRSIDLGRNLDAQAFSPPPYFASSGYGSSYPHGQPKSDPNMHNKHRALAEMGERPATSHRTSRIADVPEGKVLPSQMIRGSSPDSVFSTQEAIACPSRQDCDQVPSQQVLEHQEIDPIGVPCPPSPEEDFFGLRSLPPSRDGTVPTATSSHSASALMTPLTSPGEVISPIPGAPPMSNKDAVDHILAFQSGSSLPALLSGASSVSADLEGEFLGNPGVVNRAALIETPDSLTPPAAEKEPIAGFPLEAQEEHVVPVRFDDASATSTDATPPLSTSEMGDDGDDSDSDEGLVMAKSKKKLWSRESHTNHTNHTGRIVKAARRRDTNTSIGSTETAKKVVVHGE